MQLHIRNGLVVDPARGSAFQSDVFIADARVLAIGAQPEGFVARRVIDATGLVVAPGLVDLAARLREPGFEHKATLESEMIAALAGGVTSLVCPPDTEPPLDEPGLVEMLKFRAQSLNYARVHPLGALTIGLAGETLTEMVELSEAGCVGFSQADVPIADTSVLVRALQYARTHDFAVWLRPIDAWLGRGGVAHAGAVATRLGLSSVPVMAETVALHTIFEAVRASGARVHLCRLSSAAGLELVRAAKREGLPISCDVGAHHVHLTDVDIGYFDSNCRLDPPLRSQRDRTAIRAALIDGTIDAICSDHTPVDDDEKQLPFGEATPGATGLELLLSLTLKWGKEANLPLPAVLAKITSAAAAVLGQPCGEIGVGSAADLCLFHPDEHWRVSAQTLKSQGHNTPFLGYELPGCVRMTIVSGLVAFEAGGAVRAG
jgi:dihydroorotase